MRARKSRALGPGLEPESKAQRHRAPRHGAGRGRARRRHRGGGHRCTPPPAHERGHRVQEEHSGSAKSPPAKKTICAFASTAAAAAWTVGRNIPTNCCHRHATKPRNQATQPSHANHRACRLSREQRCGTCHTLHRPFAMRAQSSKARQTKYQRLMSQCSSQRWSAAAGAWLLFKRWSICLRAVGDERSWSPRDSPVI